MFWLGPPWVLGAKLISRIQMLGHFDLMCDPLAGDVVAKVKRIGDDTQCRAEKFFCCISEGDE